MKQSLCAKLRDRKGVAIEMALLVMVITFSFSILITATSVLHYGKKNQAAKRLEQTVALEQIARDFCDAAGSGDRSWAYAYPDEYEILILNNHTLMVKETGTDNMLLYVELQYDGGTYRISRWETQ